MVAAWVERSEEEGAVWYEYQENGEDESWEDPVVMEYAKRQRAEMDLHLRLQEQFYDGPAVNVRDEQYQQQRQLFNLWRDAVNHRWECLYSQEEHYWLRNSIIRQLQVNAANS